MLVALTNGLIVGAGIADVHRTFDVVNATVLHYRPLEISRISPTSVPLWIAAKSMPWRNERANVTCDGPK